MTAKIEYTIVSSTTIGSLIPQVQTRINNGWKPQGGIAITVGESTSFGAPDTTFYQAMIKE